MKVSLLSLLLALTIICIVSTTTVVAARRRYISTQNLLDTLKWNQPTNADETPDVNDVLSRWKRADVIGEFKVGVTFSPEPDQYRERLLLIPEKDEMPFGEEEEEQEIDELLGTTIHGQRSTTASLASLLNDDQNNNSSNSSNNTDIINNSNSTSTNIDKSSQDNNNQTSINNDKPSSSNKKKKSSDSDDWAARVRKREKEHMKKTQDKNEQMRGKEKKTSKNAVEKLEQEVKKEAEKKINKEHNISTDKKEKKKKAKEGKEEKHAWNYKQNGKDWTGLCVSGKKQSPINIETASTKSSQSPTNLQVEYKPMATATIVNNGHTLQVTNQFGSIKFQDQTYKVLQFHFHTPSEHQIDGRSSDMEMHIVHQKVGSTGTNDLLVIGVMFDANSTTSNPFLQQLQPSSFPSITKESSSAAAALDVNNVINWRSSFYSYQGSLTTPKCDETVTWVLFAQTQSMSKSELAAFSKAMKHDGATGNSRLVQPLHSRSVTVYA